MALTGAPPACTYCPHFNEVTVRSRGARCPWLGFSDNLSWSALTTPLADADVWLFVSVRQDDTSASTSA